MHEVKFILIINKLNVQKFDLVSISDIDFQNNFCFLFLCFNRTNKMFETNILSKYIAINLLQYILLISTFSSN